MCAVAAGAAGRSSRAAAPLVADVVAELADDRTRLDAPHLVALVRTGARFVNGQLVERPDEHAPPSAA